MAYDWNAFYGSWWAHNSEWAREQKKKSFYSMCGKEHSFSQGSATLYVFDRVKFPSHTLLEHEKLLHLMY
jgi:hypothetical protein